MVAHLVTEIGLAKTMCLYVYPHTHMTKQTFEILHVQPSLKE